MMENGMFLGPPRRGNDGKRNVLGAAGAGMMKNVWFLEQQARELWKTSCF
jgi:hypothetical protein